MNDATVIRYRAAMFLYKKWLVSGLITKADHLKLDTMTARKFGLSDNSVWRDINLLSQDTQGNMPPAKGGIS